MKTLKQALAEVGINPDNLPLTDSRKGEVFDPLNPTYHLDVDDQIKNAGILLNEAEKIHRKLINNRRDTAALLNASTIQAEYEKYDAQLIELYIKTAKQEENVEFFKNALQTAQELKTEFEKIDTETGEILCQ